MISKEELLEFLVDRAIEIWQNRSTGIEDMRECPLCMYVELTEPISSECSCDFCILKNCHNTPYGRYTHFEFEVDEHGEQLDAANDMLLMLKAYKERDIETFTRYLDYWNDSYEMTSYWKDKKRVL